MKNKIQDLNDHLFAQLERLNDEDLTQEELEKEIQRSKAVTAVSNQIINNAKLALDATRLQVEFGTPVRGPESHSRRCSRARERRNEID